jgi:hypothetical protein
MHLIALEPKLKRGIEVDLQIAAELQTLVKFTFHQGTIEQTLNLFAAARKAGLGQSE